MQLLSFWSWFVFAFLWFIFLCFSYHCDLKLIWWFVSQVISVLTHSSLTKIFKQRRNYDLRRLLTGAEKFFDNLLNLMDTEPGLLLTAVRCLPLDSAVREIIAQSIVQNAKVKVRTDVCCSHHDWCRNLAAFLFSFCFCGFIFSSHESCDVYGS